MSKNRKNMLGLEIGSSGIKLVQSDIIKGELIVKKVDLSALPDNIYVDGEITNLEVLAKTIKATLKKNKIRAKDCYCCVNSQQIITREVSVPNLNKENLQDMAKFEVEQYLPIEMDNYEVQSLIIKELEIDDKPVADMLVTAFPKRLIAQLQEVIAMCNLRPVVLDTQANAFGKFVERQKKINGNDYHRDSISAFIDLGYESINVHIFHKGKFRFSRILSYGAKDLDTNISKFLDIDLDEARRRKMNIHNINYSVNELSEDAKLINVVKSTLSSWFDEINKVFRYYGSRSTGNNKVEYIYIYGGLSNIEGITDFIESIFKVPTDKVRKVSDVDFHPTTDIVEVLNTLGVFYRR